MSSGQPADPLAQGALPTKAPVAAPTASAWRSGPLMGLCTALLAGLAACLVVQAVYPVFWTNEGLDEWGFPPLEVQSALSRNNAMFVLALLGGLTGVGLALGEGLARRSWKTMLAAGIACAAVGVLVGGLAGYLGHRAFEFYAKNQELAELDKAIRVNAAMLATLGAGVGLGTGLILGGRFGAAVQGLIGGLLAGVLASLLYPTIVATLFHGAATTVLIPLEIRERLVWFGLTAGLLGLILPALARQRAPRASTGAAQP